MTPLPHNPLIWVEDLPEDATNVEIGNNLLGFNYPYPKKRLHFKTIPLPPGTWKLICLGNQATEEEAREIVENHRDYLGFDGYKNYSKEFTALEENYETAKRSLRSLITANGWKNPVFVRKEK